MQCIKNYQQEEVSGMQQPFGGALCQIKGTRKGDYYTS